MCYTCNKNIQDTWSGTTGTIVSVGLSIHLPILHYWLLFPSNYRGLWRFLFSLNFCPLFLFPYFYCLLKNMELFYANPNVITEIISSTINFRITFLIFVSYFFKFSRVLFKPILWKYTLNSAFSKYSVLPSSGSEHLE